ncbi:MAG: hypothetical protein ACK4ZM_05005 [bacterium]
MYINNSIDESGVDTPEFNVILIDNAHTSGISQIYQLRGRVGRIMIFIFNESFYSFYGRSGICGVNFLD